MTQNFYEKLSQYVTQKARMGDTRASHSGTNFTASTSPASPETVTLRDEAGNGYHPFILSVDSLSDESARLI